MWRILERLTRKKALVDLDESTQLSRCLRLFDLTALGVGGTLGAGIYVISGQVARDKAGPAVILSFLLAALASWFAGLCYAEFGARVPGAGSAYAYTYTTMGEFCAFVIGWNLILEYNIGTATVARAWSSYVDALSGEAIGSYMRQKVPMSVPDMAPYPDFLAIGSTLVLTAVLALGVKKSSIINNIFTSINLLVVGYVIICGLFKADIQNWKIPKDQLSVNGTAGVGGFLPYGMSGVFAGAATCFYAFVGFDVIATTGEEVERPQRNIPLAIIFCLAICFVAYAGVSCVLTLVLPYYKLDANTPLSKLFEPAQGGWHIANRIISVGSIAGLFSSLIGGMFPMPRILYAMASDGLLFRCLACVNDRFKTPMAATLAAGVFAGGMAMAFNTDQLVEMMSIGTLLAYTLVSVSVIIIRHEPLPACRRSQEPLTSSWWTIFAPITKHPTDRSATVVKICVLLLSLMAVSIDVVFVIFTDAVVQGHLAATFVVAVSALAFCSLLFVIGLQPQTPNNGKFNVPLSPIIPALSVFANIYLMMKLSRLTWIRFSIWMVIGCIIYFAYGIRHSSLNKEEMVDGDIRAQTRITLETHNKKDNERTRLLNDKIDK